MVVIFGPQTTSAFAGIPEPALAGEFTCRKAGKGPYGSEAATDGEGYTTKQMNQSSK
jgi:hypothetical protein